MIVDTLDIITLIGGAGATTDEVSTAVALSSSVVAADSGADAALEAGVEPCIVIGDLDSISPKAKAAFRHKIECFNEQETTDFEKCLLSTKASRILAVGFSGGRLDHQLSVLNVIARYTERRIVLYGCGDVSILIPDSGMTLELPVGTRLSLMPLAQARVWSQGLRWDLSGQWMRPDGFVSISNEVCGQVCLRAEGQILLVLPAEALGQVWQQISN